MVVINLINKLKKRSICVLNITAEKVEGDFSVKLSHQNQGNLWIYRINKKKNQQTNISIVIRF